ncbi:MAG TPA: TonB-dependent receptor [Nevskiaceae bacterium]|nr:TonB-dependent receptor [Nevskiaceae bacterium]
MGIARGPASGVPIAALLATGLGGAALAQGEPEGLPSIPVNDATAGAVPAGEPARRAAQIGEIVVTAQRREENLQDVPISVTAFSADDIAERTIVSFGDVAKSTPGFVFGQTFGQVAPTIRGVGADRFTISSEPGVALYVDDIYLGRPYLPQAALTTLERIEVLKGPQGTLYGRNASGGALKLVSQRPTDEFRMTAGVQYGSFDEVVGRASVNLPIADGLEGLLAVVASERDGYVDNRTLDREVEGSEVFSVRGALAYEATDWLDIDLNADLSRQKDSGPIANAVTPVVFGFSDSLATPALAPLDLYLGALETRFGVVLDPLREALVARLVGGQVSHDPRVTYQDSPTKTDIDNEGVGLTFSTRAGDWGGKLITGYRESRRDFLLDGDMTDFPALAFVDPNFTEAHQVSAELQVSLDTAFPGLGGDVHALTGAFYYHEEGSEDINASILQLDPGNLQALGDLIPPSILPLFQNDGLSQILFRSSQLTRSVAGFGDVEWRALDWLAVHLGGRYTLDDKEIVGTVREPPGLARTCEDQRLADDFGATTVRSGLDFLIDDERMVYASFSQGYKSGGFNPASCDGEAYKPEYVDAWELGLKSRWLDGSLQLNGAVFRYDYTDIQVEKVVGFATSVVNGPKATIEGAELAATWAAAAWLTLEGAACYLDTAYGTFSDDDPFTQADPSVIDLKGNRLNKAPEWSGNAAATVHGDLGATGALSARLEWSYTGRMFYDYFNHPFAHGEAYEIWNLFLNFAPPGGRWGVQAFGKNLADEFYWAGQVTPSAVVGGPFTFYGMPRTFGVAVSFTF